jgi:CheY-like chemotaxis protein
MGKRVLIVEDEIISAMALKRMLENSGCNVLSLVTTGVDAIEEARRERPDVIAMDIHITGRMDGIEAAEAIVAEQAASIIFMTGYADEETESRAMVLRPLGFLIKPIDPAKFKALIG